MENTSLLTENFTTGHTTEDDVLPRQYALDNTGDFVLKIINLVVGSIGLVDNFFVVVVFALFINIADKVLCIQDNLFLFLPVRVA